MTGTVATPARIIETLQRFPKHIQHQFLFDRMDLYLGHGAVMNPDGSLRLIHMDVPEEVEEMLQLKLSNLQRCKKNSQIFGFIQKPDRLQFLSFISGVYTFSKAEYADILRDCWIATEFPHQMTNAKLIQMFEKADPNHLMTAQERREFDLMDDKLTIYRGWSESQVKRGCTRRRGLSWTVDEKIATWFANRWSRGDGKVAAATVPKNKVYMYTGSRGEKEVVVNPARVKNIQIVSV